MATEMILTEALGKRADQCLGLALMALSQTIDMHVFHELLRLLDSELLYALTSPRCGCGWRQSVCVDLSVTRSATNCTPLSYSPLDLARCTSMSTSAWKYLQRCYVIELVSSLDLGPLARLSDRRKVCRCHILCHDCGRNNRNCRKLLHIVHLVRVAQASCSKLCTGW